MLRLCPGLSAAARSAVWLAALGISVLLPAGSLMRSHASAEVGRGLAQVRECWALGLVAVWAVISIVRLVALTRSAARLRTIWRRAIPLEASASCRKLLEAGRRRAELCVSGDVDRPSVVGFLRPRVLLPAELAAELGPEELEHIVRHEMEHLERRDDWTNLLQKLSLAVFPLNPVLFWLDRRLCQERELACDDAVLRQTRARKAYAACLASLAESRLAAASRNAGRASVLALGAWARETELSRRVHRILGWRESSAMDRRPSGVVAGVLMVGVAIGGLELARCPELLRFADGRVSLTEASGPTDLLDAGAAVGSRGAASVPMLARAGGSAVARPMLVKAVMPEPGRRRVVLVRAWDRGHARAVRSAKRRPETLRRQVELTVAPRVVMTEWPAGAVPAARLLLMVGGDDRANTDGAPTGQEQPRFAAFATRDGWLFLSL